MRYQQDPQKSTALSASLLLTKVAASITIQSDAELQFFVLYP